MKINLGLKRLNVNEDYNIKFEVDYSNSFSGGMEILQGLSLVSHYVLTPVGVVRRIHGLPNL